MNRLLIPKYLIGLAISSLIFTACSIGQKNGITDISKEAYRPVIHFTPPVNWTNDPNGLVYYAGTYHLFYQYNPYGNQWGHMSWGHAISDNLYDWTDLPVALAEEDSTMIFSGSAMVDRNNSGGICPDGSKDCMVIVYTANIGGSIQNQCLAYSADSGNTWTKYGNNPVIDLGKKNFRDPNLFQYGNSWRMAVSLPMEHTILFYESGNLGSWQKTGEFGNAGDTSRIWECPDMVQVPVDGTDSSVWVLMISSGSPYDHTYTGMQYFIGQFDGTTFEPFHHTFKPSWLDYGKDFYAAITYNNLPDRNPVLIGWVNNWSYANEIPTGKWRGMMSLPRVLSLMSINGELYLRQKPVPVPEHFLDNNTFEINNVSLSDEEMKLNEIRGEAYIMDIEVLIRDAAETGVRVLESDKCYTETGIDRENNTFYINRKNSGNTDFSGDFPSMETAPLRNDGNMVALQVFVDRSVIELFAGSGTIVMTEQVFPYQNSTGISLFARGGSADFRKVRIRKINF